MSGQSHRYHLDQRFPPGLNRRVWLGRLMVPLTYLVMGLPLLFLLLFFAVILLLSSSDALQFLRGGPAIVMGLAGIVYSWLIVIRSAFAPLFARAAPEAALLVDLEAEPGLYGLIAGICEATGTALHDHVLLHMGPELFVMKGRLNLPDTGVVRGKLLVIGFPLFDFLSYSELEAVLAHELAHFSGDDAVYSAYIYPAFVSLSLAVSSGERLMATRKQVFIKLMVAPQLKVFRWYLGKFRANNLTVSRFRENRADFIASTICGKNVFGAGLQKYLGYRALFGQMLTELESSGAPVSGVYADFRRYAGSHKDLSLLVAGEMAAVTKADDDHPALRDRLAFIRVVGDKVPDGRLSAAIVAGHARYERQLNEMQQEVLAYRRGNVSLHYRDIVLKLRKPAGPAYRFASIRGRLGAAAVDLFFIGALTMPLGIWLNEDAAAGAFFGLWLLSDMVLECYFRQATLGKLIFRMRVAGYDGKPIGFLRSVKRNLLKMICFLPGYAGGLQAIFDANKQMVHDRYAKTIVISTKPVKI